MLFDNTTSIKAYAETNKAKKLLQDKPGNEVQLYHAGEIVTDINTSISGTITECYTQCEYWYYVIEYKQGRNRTLRQKDIQV